MVTKALPDYAICRGHDDSFGSVFDPSNPWVLSYDETMYILEHEKVPESVYNRVYSYCGNFGGCASYNDYLEGISQYDEPLHSEPVTGYVPASAEDGGIASHTVPADSYDGYNFEDSNVGESPADTIVYC